MWWTISSVAAVKVFFAEQTTKNRASLLCCLDLQKKPRSIRVIHPINVWFNWLPRTTTSSYYAMICLWSTLCPSLPLTLSVSQESPTWRRDLSQLIATSIMKVYLASKERERLTPCSPLPKRWDWLAQEIRNWGDNKLKWHTDIHSFTPMHLNFFSFFVNQFKSHKSRGYSPSPILFA